MTKYGMISAGWSRESEAQVGVHAPGHVSCRSDTFLKVLITKAHAACRDTAFSQALQQLKEWQAEVCQHSARPCCARLSKLYQVLATRGFFVPISSLMSVCTAYSSLAELNLKQAGWVTNILS